MSQIIVLIAGLVFGVLLGTVEKKVRRKRPTRFAEMPAARYMGPTAPVSGVYLRSGKKAAIGIQGPYEYEFIQVLVELDGKAPWRVVIEEPVADVGGIISHIAEAGFFASCPADVS